MHDIPEIGIQSGAPWRRDACAAYVDRSGADLVSSLTALRTFMVKAKVRMMPARLTNRWSGRVEDKVPSSYVGVRAAQLNR